jgi:hypothetical protein
LAFDGEWVVLLFHSAQRFMHLELFWVKLLIPCAPGVGFCGFFLSWCSHSIPQRGVRWILYPCRVLVVVPITSFFSSARGLEFLLFDGGARALLQSHWGILGLCALWGHKTSRTSRIAECHSVEVLGLQLWDRRDAPSTGRYSMKHWASVCLEGTRLLVPPVEWQVVTFLPSGGICHSCSLVGSEGSLAVMDSAPFSVGQEAS